MRRVYQILAEMDKQHISFYFQSQRQPTGTKFYNISYECIKGETHMLHTLNLNEVERAVELHWGHLLPSMPTMPGLPKL